MSNASKHSWKLNSRLVSVRRISLHLFFFFSGQTRQFVNYVWLPADLEETLQGYAGISSGGGGIWFGLEWFSWLHREGEQQDIKELVGMGTRSWIHFKVFLVCFVCSGFTDEWRRMDIILKSCQLNSWLRVIEPQVNGVLCYLAFTLLILYLG